MPSVEPGVYGFESGTNVFGRFQAGWYTSPTDRVGLLGDDHFRLPTVVVTTNHDLAVEAWQQYADRLRANRQQPAAPATTFWGGFGETMGAAWKGLAGGVRNLASDLSSPRFAQGGVNARTAFFRDVDQMGYWRAGLLRGVEATLSPWQLGGSIVNSSTGTVGSMWRGDMAGAGRNFATLTLDSAAAAAMIVGGRGGVSARTSFRPTGWIDMAGGFVPARFGNVERSSLRQTGATGPVAGEDAWAAAERIYSDIRADATDVAKIAQNTGIKPENIQKVKDHVFFKEHLLDRYRDYGVAPEWARFDASPEMADSWLRLTAGTQTKVDMALLKHETAEAWFMRKNGPSYLDAHTAAERRYPSPY